MSMNKNQRNALGMHYRKPRVHPNPPTAAAILNLDDAFLAVDEGGNYHESLEMIRGQKASGIYAIIAGSTVLYVGESHTGNLYDTITRHFRDWRIGKGDALGRRRGGTTYNRKSVALVWAILPDDQAQDAQYAEIQRLRPRDNKIDGHATVETE